uniref:Vesicle associated membrane protein 1a n=1 Tax=Neolamprologus brichardi TaxID=32507 RepID=A0A3Q4GAI9_NEOBR
MAFKLFSPLTCQCCCCPASLSALSVSTPDAAGTPGAPGAPEGEGGPPAQAPNLTSNRRLQQTQAQVDEVVDIMRVNVDKVLERDQKLSELDDRADALQAGASQFESSAAKLKNKYWWKNCKCTSKIYKCCPLVVNLLVQC